jgi:DNA-directed RNA polymerase subunit RPC12/RpoP
MRQDLFSGTRHDKKLFRKPRIKRAHMFDCGGAYDCQGHELLALFKCSRCSWQSDWLRCQSMTEVRQGIACPRCNSVHEE